MSRTTADTPQLYFDYDRQAWVKDGRYLRCGHPEHMVCGCYGREHEGEMSYGEAERRALASRGRLTPADVLAMDAERAS